MQEQIAVSTTPPLPGVQLVQQINNALQTVATDFAGPDDPAALAGPYMTWADTGNMLLKRRNAANSEWVTIAPLMSRLAAQSDLDDRPRIKTFAQVITLTEDVGPIIVHDMCGTAWTWVNTAYFTGYRSKRCGHWEDGWTPEPLPFQIEAIGGVWSESDPKAKRVIAHYRESGLVVPIGGWAKGPNKIADLGGGQWKAPDLQDTFKRPSGTDADTANARVLGAYQSDALQNIKGTSITPAGTTTGAFGKYGSWGQVGSGAETFTSIDFDASRVARTSSETRAASAATVPYIHC